MKIRRVGITTFFADLNHGAVLQATSLVRYVRELGYDAKIINYRQNHHLLLRPRSLRDLARNLCRLLHFQSVRRKIRRFEDFIETYQTHTTRFSTAKALYEAWPEMDAYITGSDQVWNVEQYFEPHFFLLPANPDKSRLISYAASFGTTNISDLHKDKVASALKRFHHISVREASGQKLVEKLIGEKPPIMCDPVFLHDRQYWESISRPYKAPHEYLLLFPIGIDDAFRQAATSLADHLQLPVVQFLAPTGRNIIKPTSTRVIDAGPAEFLYLVKNATFICTNSFHGTAFSLIFNKPFISTCAMSGRNTRLENLLGLFDETKRMYMAGGPVNVPELLKVDASRREQTIAKMKSSASAFLGTALS